MTPSEFLGKNSEQVARQMERETGRPCGYDEEAVSWLEHHLRALRPLGAQTRQQNVEMYGAFFGQCLAHSFAGDWTQVDNSWLGVKLGENCIVAPWRKIESFLSGQDADAPSAFFQAVGHSYAGKNFHEATYIM